MRATFLPKADPPTREQEKVPPPADRLNSGLGPLFGVGDCPR